MFLVFNFGRRVTVSERKSKKAAKMVSAVGAEQAPMSDTQLYRAAENRQTGELTNCRIARFCHNYSISALMIILNDVK